MLRARAASSFPGSPRMFAATRFHLCSLGIAARERGRLLRRCPRARGLFGRPGFGTSLPVRCCFGVPPLFLANRCCARALLNSPPFNARTRRRRDGEAGAALPGLGAEPDDGRRQLCPLQRQGARRRQPPAGSLAPKRAPALAARQRRPAALARNARPSSCPRSSSPSPCAAAAAPCRSFRCPWSARCGNARGGILLAALAAGQASRRVLAACVLLALSSPPPRARPERRCRARTRA
jgi:hypothetical protein